MTAWNRREWLSRFGLGTMSVLIAPGFVVPGLLVPGLLAEEPQVTSPALIKLSDVDEIELGRRLARELEKEETVVPNALIDHYLSKLVANLAINSQRPNLPYSIKLLNSHLPNAISLPGGFLYIDRGLIERIGSEDELAATFAHEIGHVAGRHVVNQLLDMLAARSLLKPVLDNLHQRNGVVEKIILKLGGAAALLSGLRFSRHAEAQADMLGFYEMQRAGCDPNGFLKLFAHLDELAKSTGGTPNPFLSGHPPTRDRASAIRRELKLVTVPLGASADAAKFQVFKTAMSLLVEPPSKTEPQAK